MDQVDQLLDSAKAGFATLSVDEKYQQQALKFIKNWLTQPEFTPYVPQIKHLIESKHWDYLLDSFYQIIPFGTGGRRGEVGIGPNRINLWTITASAQGHSQYLLKTYHDQAKTRGIVLVYDVREFFSNQYFNDQLDNPVRNLSCRDLAQAAACVYAANQVKVYLFTDTRTTPELSFAVRYLHAVAGDVFSASHNPPEHNGKKVYDEFGGQLIPPDDEALVNEVTQNVKEIKTLDYNQAIKQGLIEIIGQEIDSAYIKAASQVSLSSARNLKIVYTPLHGCGESSVYQTLLALGFQVQLDPQTKNKSGKFENVTFNIPNPEVRESFDTPLKFAQSTNADILLSSDPDADRIGVMVNHQGEWVYVNGNEIASILCEYVSSKRLQSLKGQGIIIKTTVTTDLIKILCEKNKLRLIGDLLVGFKYIGYQMNLLEKQGQLDNLLLGCEESHGYIAGNYVRDKDAVTAAIWLSELAAELKLKNQTLIDYLKSVYSKYGYFRNFLTEIRLPGAQGRSRIDHLQKVLRQKPLQTFGPYQVLKIVDRQNDLPIVSQSDRESKNVLVFYLKPLHDETSIKVTIRPSGTEPKIKMYFEIGTPAFEPDRYLQIRESTQLELNKLEKDFMQTCYQILGVEFPDRGFLLFWQLPLSDKLKYFEIEPQIEALKSLPDQASRQAKLKSLLSFLGSDPIQKVDTAFIAKYHQSITAYLNLLNYTP